MGAHRGITDRRQDELNWKTCAAMTEAVRTGRETFQLEFGRPMWAYLQDKPADAVTFQQGMTDLSHFLHVFEDDVAVRVLTNCAAAARPGARIVAMERVIADDPKYTFGKILDLMILCFTQGRERTGDEFRALFDRAGLRWVGITPTTSDMSLIEGVVPSAFRSS